MYTGGGYTEMAEAIHTGPKAVAALLDAKPELLEDVSTGGARPLHLCGMSRRGQLSTAVLVERGADVDALATRQTITIAEPTDADVTGAPH